MKKILPRTIISIFFILSLFSLGSAQNEERITISTYYPSPYGSYRELTVSNRQAIGDVNGDGRVDSDDLAVMSVSSGNIPAPMNGTLTVANRIGIGTITPDTDLHIRRVSTPNSDTGDPRVVLSLDAQGGGPSGRVASSRWELIASAYENPSSAAPAGNTLMLRKIEGDDIMNSFTQAFIIDEDRHIYLGRSYNAGGAWAMPENATLTLGPRSDTDGARLLFAGSEDPGNLNNPYPCFYFDNSGGNMRFFTQVFVNNNLQPIINSTERLTILNNGNVGIGTPAPEARLDIQSAGPGTELLKAYTSSGDSKIIFYEQGVNNVMTLHMAGSGGATSIMLNPEGDSFLSGGDVGIGTTPQAKLDVDGDTIIRGALNATATFVSYGDWTGPIPFPPPPVLVSECPANTFVCGVEVWTDRTTPGNPVNSVRAKCCN